MDTPRDKAEKKSGRVCCCQKIGVRISTDVRRYVARSFPIKLSVFWHWFYCEGQQFVESNFQKHSIPGRDGERDPFRLQSLIDAG